uniref:Lipocalin/cytosolic fatty-acid binding domain-containing protein n=1 Tax=Amblyomma maculatum TaxID=34609 RepID=G3MRN1_AMBMU
MHGQDEVLKERIETCKRWQLTKKPKAFLQLPHLVAISDSNNDTIMECLTLERTELNIQNKTSAYMFLFRGHHGTAKRNLTFFASQISAPDNFEFYTEEDPTTKSIVTIPYWNGINCFVADGPYHNGEQCMLFVSKGIEDEVPGECVEQFEDICGVAVPNYSRELCAD